MIWNLVHAAMTLSLTLCSAAVVVLSPAAPEAAENVASHPRPVPAVTSPAVAPHVASAMPGDAAPAPDSIARHEVSRADRVIGWVSIDAGAAARLEEARLIEQASRQVVEVPRRSGNASPSLGVSGSGGRATRSTALRASREALRRSRAPRRPDWLQEMVRERSDVRDAYRDRTRSRR